MKSELQSIHNQLSTIPFEEIRKEQSQAFEKVNKRMEALEKNFNELKDIVMKRTNQSFKMDPKLLEQWNSTMLVIRRSPWTNMRLILNKIALDNIADLFPSDWAPKPCFSEIQEKHFKILSEVKTAMFTSVEFFRIMMFWQSMDMSNFSKLYITIWLWVM